jgi:hypothetical protein
MPGFLILNYEKEGSNHLMWLLRGFDGLSIVHKRPEEMEPFDRHQCGPMAVADLVACFDQIFGPNRDEQRLNEIYMRTSDAPLGRIGDGGIPGFKMRYQPPANEDHAFLSRLAAVPGLGPGLASALNPGRYRYQRGILGVLSRHGVKVFVTVREDIFRWALSLYHGDGTGRAGHIQFDVAWRGREVPSVPAIEVDRERFAATLGHCRVILQYKIKIMRRMQRAGIPVKPLYYEELCDAPGRLLGTLLKDVGLPVSGAEIDAVVRRGTRFRKVHPTDISRFVTNHEPITAEFGHCRFAFEAEYRQRHGEPPWAAPHAPPRGAG